MPAVTMVEGGSWLVPYVGGKPFLRKPPLVQWCIATSLRTFGHHVWAARLPSALSVLALAAVMILCTRGWLIAEQSLLAAIVMMTQIGTVEKCRLAEIEAIYVALSGIAIVLWMSWWSQRRSPWLVWLVPLFFNGLALLAKAPLHLLFFYAIVVATLWAAGEMRELLGLPHIIGVLVMVGVFEAWAIPYFQVVPVEAAKQVWQRQFVERVTGAETGLVKWLINVPNGIANHLPWVLFAPLLWRGNATDGQHPRTAALLRGSRWAAAACFFVLLLIPGVLPRYLQPLTVPFSLLLAPVLWDCPRRFRHWWGYTAFALTVVVFLGSVASPFLVASAVQQGGDALHPGLAGLAVLVVFVGALLLISLRRRLHESVHLALWTALTFVMAMLLYATTIVPFMRLRENIRPFAQAIDDKMPPGERLHAYSLGDFAPLLGTLFYLQTPFLYIADPDSAPIGAQHYLVRGKDRAKFEKRFQVVGTLAEWSGKEEKVPAAVVRAVKRLAPQPQL